MNRPLRLRNVVRRYPEINGPAVLLLFCLAPHGVFPAARITSHAVSSYLAFSPLPALFSKNRRYLFCDTFRRRGFATVAPAFSTRHAAVWCSDFPLASLSTHQRSSAITCNLPRSATKEREPPISADCLLPSAEADTRGAHVFPNRHRFDPCRVRLISSPDLERLSFQTNAPERTFSPSAKMFSREQ
jgi:hypothetical protein